MTEPTVVLRAKPVQRFFTPATGIVSGGGILWLTIYLLQWWQDASDGMRTGLIGLGTILGCGSIFLVIITVYMSALWFKYRLEFTPTHLQLISISHPMIHPFRVAYEDVKWVSRGMRGQLLILPRQGKPIWIIAGIFEGGRTGVLAELSRRINPHHLEPNLEQNLWRFLGDDKVLTGFIVVLFLSLLPYFYALGGHNLVRSRMAWTTEFEPQLFKGRVEDFWIDDSNVPWVLLYQNGNFRVQQLNGTQPQTWALPDRSTLQDAAHKDSFVFYSELIVDMRGRPWVAFERDGLLRLQGEEWRWVSFLDGQTRVDIQELAITDEAMWAIVSDENRSRYLAMIDLDTGQVQEIPLSVDLRTRDAQVASIRVVNDQVLARISADGDSVFYALENGAWRNDGRIQLEGNEGYVEDYTVDSQGRLWVVEDVENNTCSSNNRLVRVGFHEPNSDAWKWFDLPCYDDDYYVFTRAIAVDRLGRVWIAIDERVDVFEATPNGNLTLITYYSTKNSAYQNADLHHKQLQLGQDGRLWVSNEKLVWLATSASQLPFALPSWTEPLADDIGLAYLFCFGWLIVVALPYLAYYQYLKSQAERKANFASAAIPDSQLG